MKNIKKDILYCGLITIFCTQVLISQNIPEFHRLSIFKNLKNKINLGDDLNKLSSNLFRLYSYVMENNISLENIKDIKKIEKFGISEDDIDLKGQIHTTLRVTKIDEILLLKLRSLGFTIETTTKDLNVSSNQQMIEGWCKIKNLLDITQLPEVFHIRITEKPIVLTGAVNTEGDIILRAQMSRNNFNIDGTGQVVGIISDGVEHLGDSQNSNDLPDQINVINNRFVGNDGNQDEGTAMLEIVHDLAPGAELAFADQGNSETDFANNINLLRDAGCTIICDDIIYLLEPVYEDGIIAQTVNNVVTNNDIVYISSAGNQQLDHYEGDFVSTDGDEWHDFSPGDEAMNLQLGPNRTIRLVLQWNNEFGNSGDNYDIYIYNENFSAILASSTDNQNGDDDPVEFISYTNSDQNNSIIIHISIWQNSDAEDRNLSLYMFGAGVNPLQYNNIGGTIYGHTSALNCLSVGAIDASDPANDDIEEFSSIGPSRIYSYDNEGNPTAFVDRQKPDHVAIDGVETRTGQLGNFPFNPFYGTSAAAPHSAGIVALLRDFNENLNATQIRDILENTSIDLGSSGFDFTYGFGRLDAFAALTFANSSGFGHDYRISDLSSNPISPIVDDVVQVVATLTNMGTNTEPSGTVIKFFVDDVFKNSTSIPSLTPSQSRQVPFSWIAEAGAHNLKIQSYLPNDQNPSNDFAILPINVGVAGNLLVDGSSAPTKNVTLNPNSYGDFSSILQNIGSATINGNVTKSGSQSSWVTLTGGSTFTLSPNTSQNYPYKITVPSGTSPGNYSATIKFSYEGGTKFVDLSLAIKVIQFTNGEFQDVLLSSSTLIDGANQTANVSSFPAGSQFYLDNYPTTADNYKQEFIKTLSNDEFNRLNKSTWYINADEIEGSKNLYLTIFPKNTSKQFSSDVSPQSFDIIEWWSTGNNTVSITLNGVCTTCQDTKWLIANTYLNLNFSKNAWATNYSISQANLNQWDTGWDYGRIYFDVSNVAVGGDLHLFINGEKVNTRSITGTGSNQYLSFSHSELSTSNYINIKGDFDDLTKVTLSNIRFKVKYFTGDPNLVCTKALSQSTININDNVTANLSFQNVGSNTAVDPNYNDSPLPTGLSLVSGSLSGEPSDIDPGITRNISYTLKGNQIGSYTFGGTTVTYENPSGSSFSTSFNSVNLVVNGGNLIVAGSINSNQINYLDPILITATVTGSILNNSISDALVLCTVTKPDLSTRNFYLIYNPNTIKYEGSFSETDQLGSYQINITGEKTYYNQGSLTNPLSFNVIANFPSPTNLTATAASTAINLTWEAPALMVLSKNTKTKVNENVLDLKSIKQESIGSNKADNNFVAAILQYYRVYRSTTQGGPYSTIGVATNNNYSDNSALGGIPYYYVVTAIYKNPSGESGYSNEASASVIPNFPQVEINPPSFTFTLPGNASHIDVLTISNIAPTGAQDLNWDIEEQNLLTLSTVSASGEKIEIPLKLKSSKNLANEVERLANVYLELPKGVEDKRVGTLVTAGFGGSDVFGYQWIDSDEPTGPAYVWNDISSTGTLVSTWVAASTWDPKDEGYSGPISIGFPFSFYDVQHSQLYIGSNGFVTFQQFSGDTYTNYQIPSTSSINNYIAPFWSDLDGTYQGTVHFKEQSDRFIIQFTNWQRYSYGGSLTYQLVLYSDGKIMFYYNDMNATLTSSTVGIENADGTDGLQIAFNTSYIHNQLAVMIYYGCPWLTELPTSSTISAGSNQNVDITVDTRGMKVGMYNCSLTINNNDPDNPQVTVPVTLNVLPGVLASLKIFLQGPFTSGAMATSLNSSGLLPLNQPYNTAPWNYNVTESVTSIPAGVVDWVLLELRSNTTTVVARRAAFLKSDGTIVDLDGTSTVKFNGIVNGNYYIVIKHRNHLGIMSLTAQSFSSGNVTNYDFTTAQNKAYGLNPMKDLGGVYGMYAGDANEDGGVFAEDYTSYKLNQGKLGYNILADFNLDGGAFAEDYTIYKFNQGKITRVP